MRHKKTFAKKSLGQNFLQSSAVRTQILDFSTKSDGSFPEVVLEIGPGLGFMTCKLVQKAQEFIAVEMDDRAIELLNKDFAHRDNFQLIHGDILATDIDNIFEQKKYSVIANIPYNITSPILRKFLDRTKNQPDQMVLMVQREVGEKICLDPEKGNRSLLSISVEIFAETLYGFTVPPEAFSPAPKVFSAVIKAIIRKIPLVEKKDQNDFFTVVQAGFSEKRKKLGNTLPKFFGLPMEPLLKGIDPDRRPQTLTIEEWKILTKNFQDVR